MAGDVNTNRPFPSLILLGIVDFCCILIGLEQVSVNKISSGVIWILVGVVSGLIGFYWSQVKRAIASVGAWFRKEPSKLIIHSAVYGAGDATDVSVTHRLNTAPKDALAIPVNNNLVSGDPDPAPNQAKRLKVTYSYGSSGPTTVGVPEHSWLILPQDPQIQRLTGEVDRLKAVQPSQSTQLALSPLQIELLQLAKDLQEFIKEMGTKPEARREDFEETRDGVEVYLQTDFILQDPWLIKFKSLYNKRFAARLQGVVNELGIHGLKRSCLDSCARGGIDDTVEAQLVIGTLVSAAYQLDDIYVFPRNVYSAEQISMMPESEVRNKIAWEPGFLVSYEQYMKTQASKGNKS